MVLIVDNKEFHEIEPITEKESLHYECKRSEGAPYLFYDFEECCDLMGHGVVFYPNGVLMFIKDENKDYTTSRSFVFYNNDMVDVFKAHNRRSLYNKETRTTEYLPPLKNIEVKVFEKYIYSKETMFDTNETKETVIEIDTGKRVESFVIREEKKSKHSNCADESIEDYTIREQFSLNID